MRWQDERYVRFYTRNTPEWCVLSWQARALFGLILREVDRAGILPVGKLGLRAVAVAVRAPWEEIEKPLMEILADGMAVHREELQLLVVPNFVEAQEASQSDKARKRTERERARDLANAKSLSVTSPSQTVTEPSGNGASRDEMSHAVTSSHSEPSRAVLAVPSSAEGATPLLPGSKEIEAEIRRHPVFASLNAHTLAEQHAGWMMTASQKLAWALRAIDDCAAAHTDLGLTAPELQRKLVGYMRNARRPKDEKPVRVVVESEPSREPTEAELTENRRRLEEREAKAKAEIERRAAMGQSFGGRSK
jgi:hypothetical protein